MATERIGPIVDANGDPYYVVERDFIGAEHLNAQAAWTRSTHAVLRRQHRADGVHDHLPIPRAVIAGRSYVESGAGHVHLDPRSTAMGYVLADGPNDPRPNAAPNLIQAAYLARGNVRFTIAEPLPSADWALINYSNGGASALIGPPSQPPQRRSIIVAGVKTATSVEIFMQTGNSMMDGDFCFALVC